MVPSTTATAPSGNVNHVPEASEPHSSSQLQEPGQKDGKQKERREQVNHTEKRRQQGPPRSDRGRGYHSSNRGNRGELVSEQWGEPSYVPRYCSGAGCCGSKMLLLFFLSFARGANFIVGVPIKMSHHHDIIPEYL